MGHQGLKNKVLAEVHQCVLLGLSLTGHVANVVRPQVVCIQQLVGKLTVSGLLCEGIVGEENLSKLLLHRRPSQFGR